MDFAQLADEWHLVADWVVLSLVLASVYGNGVWRALVALLSYFVATSGLLHSSPIPGLAVVAVTLAIFFVPTFAMCGVRRKQKLGSCVFVSGADSGMGEATAVHLAKKGVHVFAGVFLPASEQKLRAQLGNASGGITAIPLDVTSDDSVAAAAKTVSEHAEYKSKGLMGIINCAGVGTYVENNMFHDYYFPVFVSNNDINKCVCAGFNGPGEYFPMKMYQRQMDVNFFGYVRVTQVQVGR